MTNQTYTRRERQIIRDYVLDYYRARGARNVRIAADGNVSVRVDGTRTQMEHGRDMTEGRIFAGYADELLVAAAQIS